MVIAMIIRVNWSFCGFYPNFQIKTMKRVSDFLSGALQTVKKNYSNYTVITQGVTD